MTQREVEVLYGYIFRNYTRLEQEMQQRQAQMRYTECDTVQCLEAACAIERFNMFCMVAHDIRYLLNLDKCKFEDVPDLLKIMPMEFFQIVDINRVHVYLEV